MNKTHRVVWSASRGTFVVAHEYAACAGKGSTRKSIIAQSILAAAFVVTGASALGQTNPVTNLVGSQSLTQQTPPETLVITNTGTIMAAPSSGYAGVTGTNLTAAGIVNSGTILGATSSGENDTLDGIYLSGATLTNGITNTGTASYIRGQSYGIDIESGSSVAAIVNAGTITGGAAGIDVNASSVGTISNVGTASAITGGDAGILIGNGTVTSIFNQGLIEGEDSAGVVVAGTLGTLNNSGPSALITGNSVGVRVTDGGTIASLTNSGTISGETGVNIVGSASVGQIQNSGLIAGYYGGVILDESSLASLTNSGTIYGHYVGLGFFDAATVTGGVTNSGLISGTYYGGIILSGATVSGGVTNLSGGVISGASGIALYNSQLDYISNQAGATIVGVAGGCCQNTAGIAIYGSTVTGQISNAGVISGAGAGIEIQYATVSGGISNTGVIQASNGPGIDLQYFAVIAGGITNSGAGATISGSSYGINMVSTAETSNGQLIPATSLSGGIVNSGLISGTSVAGIEINTATLSGGITNLKGGTISGGQYGIQIAYTPSTSSGVTSTPTMLSGGIVNSGLISGASVAGIAVKASTISGAISNLNGGTITGGATGIQLMAGATVTGGLSNSGVISGTVYAVYVDSTSSLGPITIGGVNSAQFIGDVYATTSDVTVSSGSVYSATNAFDVNSFNVAPGATVNLSDPASTAGGASGITVANGFSNAGTVSVAQGVTGVINGAYTQSSSGTYKLGASSTSNYGVLAVNGTVDLPSAAKIYVDVASDNTLTNKEVLKGVITSTGLTASSFDVTDNLDLVSFTGLIDGNNVDLVTKVNALVLEDVLANGNYNAVPAAKVIDAIIASNSAGPFTPVIDELAKLQTSQQVSRAVSQLLPLLSGASNVSSIGTLWELDQVIQSRLEGNTGLSSGDDYLSDRGAWVKPFGSWGNQSDQGSAPGFTSNTGGIVLGADGAVSKETRLGLAFAYASSDITGKGAEASDENKVDMYQVVGYGSYALDPVTELNFQIDGGGNSNSGHRSIPAFGTNANSSYNASTAHFGVGLGRNMPIDDMTVWTPSVRVDYTWVRSDSYNETGAGPLDLNVQSASAEQLLTSVDAKIVHKINDYSSVFGNLGVGYDSLARNNTQIISAFAGAPGLPFATQGVGLKPWTVLAGFGVVATPQGGPEITVRYDLQDRSSFTEQSFSVKARWAF